MSNESTEDLGRVVTELYSPSEWLSPAECISGHYYWGHGRSIAEIAVCTGVNAHGQTEFEGWREKFGEDFLFRETHYDDDNFFGTYRPFVDLGEVPPAATEEDRLQWILDQMLELVQERLEWIRRMPKELHEAWNYEISLQMEEETLAALQDVKQNGFSSKPILTFKELLSAKKKSN